MLANTMLLQCAELRRYVRMIPLPATLKVLFVCRFE